MPDNPDRRILKGLIKHALAQETDPLTPLIEEYLIKREKPAYIARRLKHYTIPVRPRVRPPGRLSPSSLCGCERQAAFKMLGVEGKKRLDVDMELIFEDGNWRHHKWQAMFYDMEKVLGRKRFRVVSIEHRVQIRKLFIAGHLDAHIQIFIDGEWVDFIVDFKGANEWSWGWVYRRREPVPTHELQLLGYMRPKKVHKGIILYDSKDKNRFFCFVVNFSEERWAEVRMWCRSILEQLEEQQLPPMHPECDNGNFLSNRCPYKSYCFGELSPSQLRRMAYKGFTSVDDLWNIGLELEKLGVEDYE